MCQFDAKFHIAENMIDCLTKLILFIFKRDLRANLEVSVTKVLRIHSSHVQSNRLNKIKLNSAATESDDEVI